MKFLLRRTKKKHGGGNQICSFWNYFTPCSVCNTCMRCEKKKNNTEKIGRTTSLSIATRFRVYIHRNTGLGRRRTVIQTCISGSKSSLTHHYLIAGARVVTFRSFSVTLMVDFHLGGAPAFHSPLGSHQRGAHFMAIGEAHLYKEHEGAHTTTKQEACSNQAGWVGGEIA